MKHIFTYIILGLLIVSCSNTNGQLIQTSSTIKIDADDTKDSIILKAAHIVPTKNQYEALKNEFIAFIHFGPNTFTRMEWGNGFEDPKVFNLKNLDTDQWCKAMKAANMKKVILTVKHHDGFVLWQSRYTKQGIMSTVFKDGKGDILKELATSCQKYGLKLGVYLSPADLFQIENKEGLYGNLSVYTNREIPRPIEGRPFKNKTKFTFNVDDYNEYFLNQLFELLTEYGPIHEVWFDGAHPKRKGGQKYNYLAWKELISTLAPEAVVFGKQDIRWCGNEAGGTRDTEWNVIPYSENPQELNRFADITNKDIGSREQLYKANYLHYQQAETNTSIREGWFYRDDVKQKVRNADDVFDMYERSVGGNSTFLLNIPPNREGKFSPEDVSVLEEVGNRIKDTYGDNLLKATGSDLEIVNNEIIITSKKQVTINRLIIKEAINTHSERIEKHEVDAWVNGEWMEIAKATNVGYKRILRFPEVTSNKFRIRIVASRLVPVVSEITGHFYNTRPPQLSISRKLDGKLIIIPKKHDFGWKPHGENAIDNLNSGYEIRYTTDGSNPTKNSKLFTESEIVFSKVVKAVSIDKNEMGSIASETFGVLKKGWTIMNKDSELDSNLAKNAIDENPNTYWKSNNTNERHYLNIDFGTTLNLKGFAYTPQKENRNGMIEKGIVKISDDGKAWKTVEAFEFGNLINNPVARRHKFKKEIITQYIRIESKVIAGGNKTAAIAELDFFE